MEKCLKILNISIKRFTGAAFEPTPNNNLPQPLQFLKRFDKVAENAWKKGKLISLGFAPDPIPEKVLKLEYNEAWGDIQKV